MFGFRHGKGAVVNSGQHVADTLQCAHCGMHWVTKPGSGKERGWCMRCHAPLCGKAPCFEDCLPYEARIDIMDSKVLDPKYLELANKLQQKYPHIPLI